jgi:hypothetical protein
MEAHNGIVDAAQSQLAAAAGGAAGGSGVSSPPSALANLHNFLFSSQGEEEKEQQRRQFATLTCKLLFSALSVHPSVAHVGRSCFLAHCPIPATSLKFDVVDISLTAAHLELVLEALVSAAEILALSASITTSNSFTFVTTPPPFGNAYTGVERYLIVKQATEEVVCTLRLRLRHPQWSPATVVQSYWGNHMACYASVASGLYTVTLLPCATRAAAAAPSIFLLPFGLVRALSLLPSPMDAQVVALVLRQLLCVLLDQKGNVVNSGEQDASSFIVHNALKGCLPSLPSIPCGAFLTSLARLARRVHKAVGGGIKYQETPWFHC